MNTKKFLSWIVDAKFLTEAKAYAKSALLELEPAGPSKMVVRLESTGDRKIDVIKAIRNRLGWGLKESKDFSEVFPNDFPFPLLLADGSCFLKELREAGAEVSSRIVD